MVAIRSLLMKSSSCRKTFGVKKIDKQLRQVEKERTLQFKAIAHCLSQPLCEGEDG
jgi:hypothetical protein